MRIAIHQPNYLPWIGYFSKIHQVDSFVFLDDVQFERGKTFTSRTKIIIAGEEAWLTIPVRNKSSLSTIKATVVDNTVDWQSKHLKTIYLNYKKAPFFGEVYEMIEKCLSIRSEFIVDYNQALIKNFCQYLNICSSFYASSDILRCEEKTGLSKILAVLEELKADCYVSGSGAGSKRYIDQSEFKKRGIELEWIGYTAKVYKQFNSSKFIENLSIIDLMMNYGRGSLTYI